MKIKERKHVSPAGFFCFNGEPPTEKICDFNNCENPAEEYITFCYPGSEYILTASACKKCAKEMSEAIKRKIH